MALPRLAPLVWCAAQIACGAARSDREGTLAPTHLESSPALGGPQEAADTTTTTAALGKGHEAQGEKLNEVRVTPGSTTSGLAAPAADPRAHAHDPGRSPDDIRAIIVAHRDQARACYDHALAAHPGIEGDLVLRWTIDPKGNVTQALADESRSQIAEPAVIECIAKVIKRIQFAASPGGFETKALYPFHFSPRHNAQQAQ